MFAALLPRPTKVVTISGATNDVNLRTLSGSPGYPLNLLCFINATVGSTSVANPAFRTGTGWTPGTFVYIDNNSTITGRVGENGTPGNPGNAGSPGNAGAQGNIGNPGNAGTAGAGGNTGSGGAVGFTPALR